MCEGPSWPSFDLIPDIGWRGCCSAAGRGQARPDALRLGLDVSLQGALIARDGALSQRLYAVGPITKGLFWEMTSVPDIRRQCELLATHLAQIVASHRFGRLTHDGLEAGSETASLAALRQAQAASGVQ
jgi:hypothetical protein